MTSVIKLTQFLYKRLFPVANVGVSDMGRNAQGACVASVFCIIYQTATFSELCDTCLKREETGWFSVATTVRCFIALDY